ncbi:MAG: GGDEF domain-containing protein [Candidatus Deferrimicrobiaceae bacterium]
MTIATGFFDRLPRPARLLVGTIVVFIIGLADYATGEEISISIFYLLPVAITTWFMGRNTGIYFAAISAVAWLTADLFGGHRYSHPAIPYWNMLVRFGFFLIILIVLSRLKDAYEHVKTLSSIDPLTGVLNGRAFQERANAELARARRYSHPFTVAYIDLDNFKAVNDRFGHSTGNTVLCTVADTASGNLRTTDIVARLGGDEFAILFPETGEESARAVLSKLRDTVSGSMQTNGWPITLSIGAVTFRKPPESVDRMLKTADALMYEAKRDGKSRIRHEIHGG